MWKPIVAISATPTRIRKLNASTFTEIWVLMNWLSGSAANIMMPTAIIMAADIMEDEFAELLHTLSRENTSYQNHTRPIAKPAVDLAKASPTPSKTVVRTRCLKQD